MGTDGIQGKLRLVLWSSHHHLTKGGSVSSAPAVRYSRSTTHVCKDSVPVGILS